MLMIDVGISVSFEITWFCLRLRKALRDASRCGFDALPTPRVVLNCWSFSSQLWFSVLLLPNQSCPMSAREAGCCSLTNTSECSVVQRVCLFDRASNTSIKLSVQGHQVAAVSLQLCWVQACVHPGHTTKRLLILTSKASLADLNREKAKAARGSEKPRRRRGNVEISQSIATKTGKIAFRVRVRVQSIDCTTPQSMER